MLKIKEEDAVKLQCSEVDRLCSASSCMAWQKITVVEIKNVLVCEFDYGDDLWADSIINKKKEDALFSMGKKQIQKDSLISWGICRKSYNDDEILHDQSVTVSENS